MAVLVAKELGRALHQTQWARYESGESEPPLAIIRAAANVSGLSEAYIAFGNRLLDSVKVHKLTEEQVELAKRVAESERRERQQQEKRQKGRGKAG